MLTKRHVIYALTACMALSMAALTPVSAAEPVRAAGKCAQRPHMTAGVYKSNRSEKAAVRTAVEKKEAVRGSLTKMVLGQDWSAAGIAEVRVDAIQVANAYFIILGPCNMRAKVVAARFEGSGTEEGSSDKREFVIRFRAPAYGEVGTPRVRIITADV